jgi:cytochrome c oxidase cbb3-type subunit I/II
MAGVTQGLMWRAFDETGRLAFPDFIETVIRLIPMYWVRVVGGTLYVAGVALGLFNLLMTWGLRPRTYAPDAHEAPALGPYVGYAPRFEIPRHPTMHEWGYRLRYFSEVEWHRIWERRPVRFTVWVTVAVAVASLFEIIPTFLVRANIPTIASVKPYSPLELMGRDIYVAEGCYNCHSQMIRPFRAETLRYGEYSRLEEFIYDRPFQWGSKRTGPDLHREGGKYPHLWHYQHLIDPRSTSPGSNMPSYAWMKKAHLDLSRTAKKLQVMRTLGVPYSDAEIASAAEQAREQARGIQTELARENVRIEPETKLIALIAYLQRLGRGPQLAASAVAGSR